jgi:flagellar basal-body rod modification protein FlgD
MAIVGIDYMNTNSTRQSASQTGATGLTSKQFLSLFLAQIQKKDPTNPMDTAKMAEQLYHMTQLQQTAQNNSYLASLINSQGTSIKMKAIDMIGHSVWSLSDSISVTKDGAESAKLELGSKAEEVEVKIYDSKGALIKTISKKDLAAGEHNLEWDQTDDNGEKVPEGNYTFKVTAKDVSSKSLDMKIYAKGKIESVGFENGEVILYTAGGRKFKFGNIVKIT